MSTFILTLNTMFSKICATSLNELTIAVSLQEILTRMIWLGLIVIIAIILYRIRIRSLKRQKHQFAQEALKQTELLTYAKESENRARDEARNTIKAKRDLLTRISHEIRTPMNGVMGMTSLLKETALTAEQREYCETIRRCGEVLLASVNDILFDDLVASSKVEWVKMDVEKEFDLRNCIDDVLEVFAGKAALIGLELLCQVDPEVPATIISYSVWIRQILLNLLENAIRFTQRGEVMVFVHMRKSMEGSELIFEVVDTGVGISKDKMNVLLNQLSDAESIEPNTEGKGSGLIISQKLVSSMGGHLVMESIASKGTTIRFSLPVKTILQPARAHVLDGIKGKKILIVDDNLASLNALRNKIEEWNLIPVAVSSGKQAMEIMMKNSDIDLVLTDMAMPEMNGVSVAKALRKQNPFLPIILLSVGGEENSILNPGLFSSVVNKPIRYLVLGEHIFSSLRNIRETSSHQEKLFKQKLEHDFAKRYPMRVLIAEDDPVNQKLTLRVLDKLGYKPDLVTNGKEVLEVVSNVNYDLILMDVEMPEMNGLETTKMIRLCLKAQPTIIALTANAMQGDREDCMNAGMDDYLSKPVNIEELVILLEKSALQIKRDA